MAPTSSSQARRAIPFALLAVLTIASLVAAWASSRPSAGVVGPEGVVVPAVGDLAPASTTAGGKPVGVVTCQSAATEVVNYHIHVLVNVYVDGQRRRLPAGIGITPPALVEHYSSGAFLDVGPYDCLYWIHTHVADGVVHVEAPHRGAFTLGQLFDVWGQPLGAGRVGPARGAVVIFENGRRLSGDPRATPLSPHGVIQIDVGQPVVPFHAQTFTVAGSCGQGTNSCSTPAG